MIDTEIKSKKDCMGCYACENICSLKCISMISDSEGFWYPKVDYKCCIYCRKCVDVCPIINKNLVDNVPIAFACINKNDNVRLKSSSGGIFTLFAEKVIKDGGIVFGVSFNQNFEVEHNFTETLEGFESFLGSKYVQSKIGDSYIQVKCFLEKGRKVLFTGTPCQIGGLYKFLNRTYNNLFTIDIICHGVPSPLIWEKYIKYREKKSRLPITKINFRNKTEGWRLYSMSFLFKNNSEYRQTLDKDLYMKIFLQNICLRPSCYACEFKSLHRQSDITLADFWGIKNILPDMDDNKGTSLVFINSKYGQEMFYHIVNNIFFKEVDINKSVKYNMAAIKSIESNPKRELFFNDLEKIPFDKLLKKYSFENFLTKLIRKVKITTYNALKKIGFYFH